MTDPWTFSGEPVAGGNAPGTVTLLEGTTFCISSSNGDIAPGGTEGLFVHDSRVLSCWLLRIDGRSCQALSAVSTASFVSSFVAREPPTIERPNPTVLVIRRRDIGDGMREEIVVRNLGAQARSCLLTLEVGSDFGHLFEVKEGMVRPDADLVPEVAHDSLAYTSRDGAPIQHLVVRLPAGSVVTPGHVSIPLEIAARASWQATFAFEVSVGGVRLRSAPREAGTLGTASPDSRLADWKGNTPRFTSGHDGYALSLSQASKDLGALRLFDPRQTEDAVIAAGSPWFMALFGRDSLITSMMTLIVDPRIATGTLKALARRQGTMVDVDRNEEPGKILHEVRFRFDQSPAGGETAYFGSVDATPLFVMLMGQARRWGLPLHTDPGLVAAADGAIAWIETYGDLDGDGFVEYHRSTEAGLANQGWKDSTDGINFASGEIAESPIALCEVQGYVYAAYIARYHLALELHDEATADHCRERAEAIKVAFNERFWIADRGWFAVGLDRDKRQIDALTSNVGHCLWTGIVDDDKASALAQHLLSKEMFTGFGVRTLSTEMGAYNPMSYHNGSVWPHDSAIIAAGLMRYGFVGAAQMIAVGLVEASEAFGYRLPELFCGFDRSEFADPVAYPAACAPQAWSSASLFSLLRTLLRFDPLVPSNRLWLAPEIPAVFGALSLENVPLDGFRLSVEATPDGLEVGGLPEHFELIREHFPADRFTPA